MLKDRKTIVPLSIDHKPNDSFERKRIEKCGGEVDQDGSEAEPFRVFVKHQKVPGIAMSLSIGDLLASSIGVIPLPEIKEVDLNEDVKFVVIASDGLWEFISNGRVALIGCKYYKYNNPQKLCEVLLQKSIENWEREEDAIDDITIISLFF